MRPDAPEYAKHGPYWVGYKPIVIGEGSDHPLQASIWYPALNPTGAEEDVTYTINTKIPVEGMDATEPIHGHALLGAEFDTAGAPYPLVIYSHGFAANAAWASAVLEHLASHGFIVVAPEHVEQFDFDWSEVPNSSIDRPRDIKQTLDYAEQAAAPEGDLAWLIDMENVAVVGHSYGGYTALAMAGAQYDLDAFNARCAALAADDPKTFLCAPIVPREADMAARAGLEQMPAGLWPPFGDPRVKAILPIAGDSYLFDKAGLSKIAIPLMAIGGTADTGTPFDWGAEPAYTYASSPRKTLVGFGGGEHFHPGHLRCHALVVCNSLLSMGLLRSCLGQGEIYRPDQPLRHCLPAGRAEGRCRGRRCPGAGECALPGYPVRGDWFYKVTQGESLRGQWWVVSGRAGLLYHSRTQADPTLQASPHVIEGSDVTVSDLITYSRERAPSVGLLSNIEDLTRWMLADLNQGTLQGEKHSAGFSLRTALEAYAHAGLRVRHDGYGARLVLGHKPGAPGSPILGQRCRLPRCGLSCARAEGRGRCVGQSVHGRWRHELVCPDGCEHQSCR